MTPFFYKRVLNNLNETNSNYFRSFIKNKNIIIVGPSRYLLNKNRGSEIDSFQDNDIVVKINNGYKLRPIDYGKRCEVLYINNKLQKENQDIVQYIRNIKIQIPALKCIVFTKINSWRILEKIDNIFIFYISRQEYINATNPIKMSYLLGTCAILNILLCNPKKVKLIGFDFYEKLKIAKTQLYYKDIYPEEYHSQKLINSKLNITHKDLNKSDLFFLKYLIFHKNNIDLIKNIDIVLDEKVKNILDKYNYK